MEVYLDNSATTQCFERVKDIVVEAMMMNYGNPSSMHTKGVGAEQYIKQAKTLLARLIKGEEKELYFTSGGTEANNLAIIGYAQANKRAGIHLITTNVEHPSVTNSMKYLEEQGFRITYLPVNQDGVVTLEQVKEAICEDTILVSMMYVNNEIGAVMPIESVGRLLKEQFLKVAFHVDGIQAFGKYRIFVKRCGIDLLSISGHKIHGPKGIGCLYIRDKIKVKPIIFGGDQQKGIRSGTENVPGIAGLKVAAELSYENFEEKVSNMRSLKRFFIDGIANIEGTSVHGKIDEDSAPHIISVGFQGVKSEVLLHTLEDRGIYVSAGSACASNKSAISATLKGIGIRGELLDSTLRFSLGLETNKEEMVYCIQVLEEVLPMLRKYARH